MTRGWKFPTSGSTRALAAVLGVGLAAALVVGCGSSKTKTTTKAPASPSSNATSDTASDNTATEGTSGPTSVWARNAVAYRGQNGTTFQITCTSQGTAGSVWGTGPYTDDSSICTAAVQSGLITLAKGGSVTYKIAAGQSSYDGGLAHGITSGSYASWPGSFTFPDASGAVVATSPASWGQSMAGYRGQNGKQVTVVCSAKGDPGSVWGSGPFTDDSSVCTAGVFAGIITTAKGGSVVATMAPGQKSYKGGTAHGVTTSDYGEWSSSFTVAAASSARAHSSSRRRGGARRGGPGG